MENLPKLNSIKQCTKCGLTADSKQYRGFDYSYFAITQEVTFSIIKETILEYIIRKCPRCRYEWYEACLDVNTTVQVDVPSFTYKTATSDMEKFIKATSTEGQGIQYFDKLEVVIDEPLNAKEIAHSIADRCNCLALSKQDSNAYRQYTCDLAKGHQGNHSQRISLSECITWNYGQNNGQQPIDGNS